MAGLVVAGERERERAFLGIIHNGGSRAEPADSASPYYGSALQGSSLIWLAGWYR